MPIDWQMNLSSPLSRTPRDTRQLQQRQCILLYNSVRRLAKFALRVFLITVTFLARALFVFDDILLSAMLLMLLMLRRAAWRRGPHVSGRVAARCHDAILGVNAMRKKRNEVNLTGTFGASPSFVIERLPVQAPGANCHFGVIRLASRGDAARVQS